MPINHGVYTSEQATSVSTPVVAECGIPYVVGTAPVQSADNPAPVNFPVICTTWSEAKERLGYSDDWENYTLCEFMYSHFKLFAVQPVIFCNVLDPGKTTSVSSQSVDVSDHVAVLPIEAVNNDNLTVLNVITELKADEDYSAYYSDDGLCIELLEDGSAYNATSLICSYDAVQPGDVDTSDISTGIDNIDYCLPGIGVIPDLLCCPGWSTDTTVASLMDAKAASISGLFSGKAIVDIDTTECTSYTDCTSYKSSHNLTGEDTILCWPMVKNGNYTFHMSTQLAGLMAQIDAENTCPYESPDNKNLKMDSTVLQDGTEILLSLAQANMLNGEGIVTALNFMSAGWVAWGSYTACYPSNTDVKDYIIPVSRMFSWVASTMIQTFWSKVGKPMNRRLLGTIVDTCNIWLNGLVKNQYLLGGRAEMLADENPDANLMAGIVKIHLYLTPPSPAQEIDFVLEYDADYVASALEI